MEMLRRELNAYRQVFNAAAKELRIIADALEAPLNLSVPTLDQTPVSVLKFDKIYETRLKNALSNHRIRTLGELSMLSDGELLRVPNFSRGSLNALKNALAEHGKHLAR